MKTPRLAVLLMLLVFSGNSVAEICKWVDENGVAHYAETCPEDVDSTEIKIQAAPSQAQVEEAIIRSDQSVENRKARKDFDKQQPEIKAAEIQALKDAIKFQQEERKQEVCQRVKSVLEQLKMEIDEKGLPSTSQRESRENLEEYLSQYCN